MRDTGLRRILHHASAMLADVYSMLDVPRGPDAPGGGCNFAMGLVLVCILDGLATEVWPVIPSGGGDDQLARMQRLATRFDWPERRGHWITRQEAIKVLYHEARNPLVHNLGANTHWRGRPRDFADAAIVVRMRDWAKPSAEELETLIDWPEKWPVVFRKPKPENGDRRFVVSVPALYWHVKQLAAGLAGDAAILREAVELRKKRRVK